jgi:hypothetical protein
MTNDDGRKPEGAPERSPKAGVGAPSGVDGNGPKRFSAAIVRRRVIKIGRFGKPVAPGGGPEPLDIGFLDKATSMGYGFRASFKGVMTFPSGTTEARL